MRTPGLKHGRKFAAEVAGALGAAPLGLNRLRPCYLISLRAFCALDDVEFDLVAFLEALVAVKLNGTVVDEDVRATVVT